MSCNFLVFGRIRFGFTQSMLFSVLDEVLQNGLPTLSRESRRVFEVNCKLTHTKSKSFRSTMPS